MEEGVLRRNIVAGQSEIKKGPIEKNGVARHSKRGDWIKDRIGDMSKVDFLDQEITKCNWQKNKTLNLQVDKKKHLIIKKTIRHISSGNQDPA